MIHALWVHARMNGDSGIQLSALDCLEADRVRSPRSARGSAERGLLPVAQLELMALASLPRTRYRALELTVCLYN